MSRGPGLARIGNARKRCGGDVFMKSSQEIESCSYHRSNEKAGDVPVPFTALGGRDAIGGLHDGRF